MRKIENSHQALVQALALAITAPTDELSDECAAMAEGLAAGMTEKELEAAKAEALKLVNGKEEVE
jgi:hypothetical protein